jgi:hypothetical protein
VRIRQLGLQEQAEIVVIGHLVVADLDGFAATTLQNGSKKQMKNSSELDINGDISVRSRP